MASDRAGLQWRAADPRLQGLARPEKQNPVPKKGTDCPQNRDVSNIPSTGGKRTRSTANATDPEQALVERVASLSGLSNLNMTPAAIVTALKPTTHKRLLAELKAGRLTDGDLTREAVTVAKANRAERHAARIVGPMP